jgi:predicted secreted Zn-dependent protease
MKKIITVLLFALSCTGVSHAKINMSVDSVYYDVRGYNIRQLRDFMKSVARRYTNSFTYGETDYTLNWRYMHQNGVRGCFVGQVFVTMRVVQTLPKLHEEVVLDVADYKRWAAFMKALEYFHDRHQNIIFRYAKLISTQVKALRPANTCEALEEAANNEVKRLLNDMKAERDSLNWDTNYGAMFGATLSFEDDFR